MSKYWSKEHLAFYDDGVVPVASMPSDAVVIPDANFKALMEKQAAGEVIVAGSDGYPTTIAQTCSPCTGMQHDQVIASAERLGHVRIGSSVRIEADGTIDIGTPYGEARTRDVSKPTYGLT